MRKFDRSTIYLLGSAVASVALAACGVALQNLPDMVTVTPAVAAADGVAGATELPALRPTATTSQSETSIPSTPENKRNANALDNFIFGKYNWNQPFKAYVSKGLAIYSGRGIKADDGRYQFIATQPLPLTTSWFSGEQNDVMVEAGKKNDSHPFDIMSTDINGLIIIATHAFQRQSIGEAGRNAVDNILKGNGDYIIGQTIDFEFADGNKITGEVVGGIKMDEDLFMYGTNVQHIDSKTVKILNDPPSCDNCPSNTWGIEGSETDGYLFARTSADKMNFPQEMRDIKPGEFIVAFVSCDSEDGNVKDLGWFIDENGNPYKKLDNYLNSRKRVVMFVKFNY